MSDALNHICHNTYFGAELETVDVPRPILDEYMRLPKVGIDIRAALDKSEAIPKNYLEMISLIITRLLDLEKKL